MNGLVRSVVVAEVEPGLGFRNPNYRYARTLAGNLRVVAFCAPPRVDDLQVLLSSAKNQLEAVKNIYIM